MKIKPYKQILLTAIPFAVLGIAFKVMTLIEGLTEIRPANAIPIVAGLLFGPYGAIGCAVGNLVADCFGTLNLTSILGVIGNFMAAFIPWKLWYLFKKEKPNVHTYKNIAVYIFLSLVSALSVAWILGFGLEVFFNMWIKEIYKYVFINNLAFSIGLGMPLFIVFTSDSINVEPHEAPKSSEKLCKVNYMALITGIYVLLMLVILAGVITGYHFDNSIVMKISSFICFILLAVFCFMPLCKQKKIS